MRSVRATEHCACYGVKRTGGNPVKQAMRPSRPLMLGPRCPNRAAPPRGRTGLRATENNIRAPDFLPAQTRSQVANRWVRALRTVRYVPTIWLEQMSYRL